MDCDEAPICASARPHVSCARCRATRTASLPSRLWRHQVLRRTKRNPMSPPSTNLSYGESSGMRTAVAEMRRAVGQLNDECQFWKKRWYLALSVNACLSALQGVFLGVVNKPFFAFSARLVSTSRAMRDVDSIERKHISIQASASWKLPALNSSHSPESGNLDRDGHVPAW